MKCQTQVLNICESTYVNKFVMESETFKLYTWV